MSAVTIRPLQASDPIADVTRLLHAAFVPLQAQGLNFTSATQTDADTVARAALGTCLVAEMDREIVGTLTVIRPGSAKFGPEFDVAGAAVITQFGVRPDRQGAGVGRALLLAAETLGRDWGASSLVLDTAEPATELIDWYVRDGYAKAGHVQWKQKTYRSVILQKEIK